MMRERGREGGDGEGEWRDERGGRREREEKERQ